MKPPSKAQLWARERNWNKARLIAARQTLINISTQKSTLPSERSDFEFTSKYLTIRIDTWDDLNKESKKKFLKD